MTSNRCHIGFARNTVLVFLVFQHSMTYEAKMGRVHCADASQVVEIDVHLFRGSLTCVDMGSVSPRCPVVFHSERSLGTRVSSNQIALAVHLWGMAQPRHVRGTPCVAPGWTVDDGGRDGVSHAEMPRCAGRETSTAHHGTGASPGAGGCAWYDGAHIATERPARQALRRGDVAGWNRTVGVG